MNHLDRRNRGRTTSSGSDELPRFDLPGESAPTGRFDAADAALTSERPALRRASRPAIRRASQHPKGPDETDEVAVEQILLEAYVEPPPPKRPPPPPLVVPAPPAPSQLAEIDALLEHSPQSVAPVALPIPPPPPQPIYVHDATGPAPSRVGVALAMTAVFLLTAAASFTLLAKPETIARMRGAFTTNAVAIAAPPAHLGAPTLRAVAPPQVAPPPPAPVPTLAVESLPKPVTAPTMTLVTLPRYAEGHRIFVDGVAVTTSEGTLSTRCGRHAIKIGSAGKGRTLDLPCGGELILK